MPLINFCNLNNSDNLGDCVSCPLDYFLFIRGKNISFSNLESITNPIIFGGGGLLHQKLINILQNHASKTNILWGIGINEHELTKQYFPSFINNYGLIGIRDWNNPWNYVPCVSCMSTVFDSNIKPQEDCIIYEHKDFPIPIKGQLKTNNKLNKFKTLNETICFLSMGETIITNSYHGAYWGLLLNRKVLIFEPFSNRFFGFKYQPLICDRNNWITKLKQAQTAPQDYLQECRNLNIRFYDKISNFLNLF